MVEHILSMSEGSIPSPKDRREKPLHSLEEALRGFIPDHLHVASPEPEARVCSRVRELSSHEG